MFTTLYNFVLKRILNGLGVEDSMFKSIHRGVVGEAAKRRQSGKLDGEMTKEKEHSALLYALPLNLRWKNYLIVFNNVQEEDIIDEKLDKKLKESDKWRKYISDGFRKGSTRPWKRH